MKLVDSVVVPEQTVNSIFRKAYTERRNIGRLMPDISLSQLEEYESKRIDELMREARIAIVNRQLRQLRLEYLSPINAN